ncbi:helix-turn-helix domain-containing protein [Methylobacterium radiotolerans]|uniref:helix-turn-helix domain-containing protein n=1 Tax=Methylobacterium radiotolerans TaxID=31998 RepID=UPI002E17E740
MSRPALPTGSPGPKAEAPRAAPVDPLAYRPRDAAAAIGVSEALLYELISEGALPARKLRGATIILRSDLVSTPSASSSDPPKQKSPLPWVRPHWGRARDALADDRGAWGPAAA